MNKLSPIYLDYAASTPVAEEVLNEMLPFFSSIYSNPSNTINSAGQVALQAVRKAEDQIKELVQGWEYEVIFTSGATESINTCLKSLFSLYGHSKKQIITCKTEHKAVLSVCEYLETLGAELEYLPVDTNGNISLNELEQSISEQTLAVVLMAVNNETGVLHDLEQVAAICQEKSVAYVCDATQAVGKLPFDLSKISPDYLIFSGHKMYAPKGIGVLMMKKGTKLIPLLHGGAQQNNFRSGTLNVPGIVGIGGSWSSKRLLFRNDEVEHFAELEQLAENIN